MNERCLRLLLIVLLVAAGCTPTPTITAETSPTAQFSAYRTYGWASRDSPPLSPPMTAPPLGGMPDWRVRNAVDRNLAARGWVTSNAPDVIVAYGVQLQEANTESFSDYARYVQQGGREGLGGAFVNGYQEGTLVLNLYDGNTGVLVWHGTATAVVGDGGNSDLASTTVQQLLAKLPRQ